MAGTAVVATGCAGKRPVVDGPALARSVRALVETGWNAVLVPPPAPPGSDLAGSLTLALGQSRSGRRAVPVMTHTLVDPADPALADPADPALADPEAGAFPEPLAVLEAEAIAALVRSGFLVVVAGQGPVVPHGSVYRPVAGALDPAATARRLAGDLGAPALVFVAGDDGPLLPAGPAGASGEIDVIEAERLAGDAGPFAAELRAAVRFVRAGGELAVITTPSKLPACLDGPASSRVLRVRRTVARPRSDAPLLAAGWC